MISPSSALSTFMMIYSCSISFLFHRIFSPLFSIRTPPFYLLASLFTFLISPAYLLSFFFPFPCSSSLSFSPSSSIQSTSLPYTYTPFFQTTYAQSSSSWFKLKPIGGDFRLFHSVLGDLRLSPQPDPLIAQSLNQQGSSGMLTARLKMKGDLGAFKWEVHPLFSSRPQSSGGLALNANPSQFAQALPLSVNVVDSQNYLAQLRADRFLISKEFDSFKITLGRQAITLGQGRAFTPLDRLAPFSPTSIDQQYKPGLDALRVDFWWGIAGQASFIVAYRQEWSRSGMAYVATAQDHFGGWDIHLLAGEFQRDWVFGLSTAGSLGPLSIYGDFSWTYSNPDLLHIGDPDSFIRTSLGLSWSWAQGGGGSISTEVYWQEDGASLANQYLLESQDPRMLRGERWFLGQYYAMLSAQQSINPLLQGSLSLLSNLKDGSGLIGSTLSWSVRQDVDVVIGGYGGYGEGMVVSLSPLQEILPPELQSEFGVLTWMGFAMMATYF